MASQQPSPGPPQVLADLKRKHEASLAALADVRTSLARTLEFLQMARKIVEGYPESKFCTVDEFVEMWSHQVETLRLKERYHEKQMIRYGRSMGLGSQEPVAPNGGQEVCDIMPELMRAIMEPVE